MRLPGYTAEVSLGRRLGMHAPLNVVEEDQTWNHQEVTPQAGLALYGNYCGPGHGDPSGKTKTIDAVDAVCRAHDLCYGSRGYFDCVCDRMLRVGMGVAFWFVPPAGKAFATAAATWFGFQPCLCHNRACFFGNCFNYTVPGVGGFGPC